MLKLIVSLCLHGTRILEFHSMATQSCTSPEESHPAPGDSKVLHEWPHPPHRLLLPSSAIMGSGHIHPSSDQLGHDPTSQPLTLLSSLPGNTDPSCPQKLLLTPQSWLRHRDHLLCEASRNPRSVLSRRRSRDYRFKPWLCHFLHDL